MDLDLVYRRHDCGAAQERVDVRDHEVADPDRADLAVSEQRLQGTVGLQGPVEGRRQGLVQDQQVGGVWKTPRPTAGISMPLLSVIVSSSSIRLSTPYYPYLDRLGVDGSRSQTSGEEVGALTALGPPRDVRTRESGSGWFRPFGRVEPV